MSDAAEPQFKALQTKVEKLELALSAIIDAIAWLDEEGRIQWCSAQFRRLVGKSDLEILGSRLVELLPLEDHGRTLPESAHPVSRAVEGQPNAMGSYDYRKGDQTLVLEILAARVQMTKHERSTVVAIRDVTERKQAEELVRQLAQAATASAETERKRAAELDKAYQELKNTQAMLIQAEKMAAVGQLASGIAHEVKNPLGIILQGVNYIELEIGPEQQKLFEVLQMIKEAVRRSDKIIRDLLNFSRQAPLASQPCQMEEVIDSSLNLVEKQLLLKDIKITKDFAPALAPVMLDENQMKQVLINIVLNAVQAMPNGGQLHFKLFMSTLQEVKYGVGRRANDLFHPGDTVLTCEVTDTGTGIAPDVLARVFDPFFTTKPAGEGTGLGLAITRSIVERHRGLIDLSSTEGCGTTVRITLPIAEVPTRITQPTGPASS